MTIVVDNVHARTDSEQERYRLNSLLWYRHKGYKFTPAGKKGWNGRVSLVSKSGHFPAGLIPHVKAEHPDITIVDNRTRPPVVAEMDRIVYIGHQLMPHQRQAVYDAHQAGRGIVEHAVGGGKSTVAVALTQRCAVPTLVLVHTKVLLYQMLRNFHDMLNADDMLGMIGDGRWEPNLITVSTYQSIVAANKQRDHQVEAFMKTRQCVIVDEVQHISAKTYEQVMQQAANAYYRFGVSATAFKSHDLGQKDVETYYKVVGWTGPVVSRFTEAEGVEVKRLVPADIFIVDYDADKTIGSAAWPLCYQLGIVGNRKRNDVVVQLAAKSPKPCLILVKDIEHGDLLSERFDLSLLVDVPFLYGTHSSPVREKTLDRMRKGEIPILISSVILDEGTDVPDIRTVVLAGGTKARHRIKQRIGRGMRAVKDKRNLMVWDFADAGKYLGAHARSRQALYDREEMFTPYYLTLKDALDAFKGGAG